jgi:hypothetical protein
MLRVYLRAISSSGQDEPLLWQVDLSSDRCLQAADVVVIGSLGALVDDISCRQRRGHTGAIERATLIIPLFQRTLSPEWVVYAGSCATRQGSASLRDLESEWRAQVPNVPVRCPFFR